MLLEQLESRTLMAVMSDDLVRYMLEVHRQDGTNLSTDAQGRYQVNIGDTLQIRGLVQDNRGGSTATAPYNTGEPYGVFGAYMDVLFDNKSLFQIRYGETQRLIVTAPASTTNTTNSFTLSFNGQTTSVITRTGSLAGMRSQIQSALEGLSNVGVGNVDVTTPLVAQPSPTFDIRFKGTLGEADRPAIQVTNKTFSSGDASITDNFRPADPTNQETFKSSFNLYNSPYINGPSAIPQTTDEDSAYPASTGTVFGEVGTFLAYPSAVVQGDPTNEYVFFSVDVKAVAAGTLGIWGSPADSQKTLALDDPTNPNPKSEVPASAIGFVRNSLGAPLDSGHKLTVLIQVPIVANGQPYGPILEDAGVTPLNVLANNGVIINTGAGGVTPATLVSAGPTTDLAGNPVNPGTIVVNTTSSPNRIDYTPAANYNGTFKFAYTAKDAAAPAHMATATVTVTVSPVNDAPSLTASSPSAVNEDAAPQVIANWAAFYSGAANETQAVKQYTVSGVSNPALFKAGPSVDTTGKLTYTPADNANGSSKFVVAVQDNGGTPGVDTSASQTFTIAVTAVNDPPSFTKGANPTVPEDAGPQSVANWATNTSKGPADESGQTVNFIVANNNAALFSAQPAISSTGTLTYTPAANANGTATVTVQLHDNGGTANLGKDTSDAQTFTIAVTAVNDAPGFAASNPPAVNEDAGPQAVTGWATFSSGAANETQAVKQYTVSGVSNPSLFKAGPAVDTTGKLTYTPADNVNGSSKFVVAVQDNGGTPGVDTSASQTFTITVASVNDPPTFTKGADPIVREDAGKQTVANWATNFSKGPANEAGQKLKIVVSNDNPSLFSAQPALSSTGTLTYTPAVNANGRATVKVQLQDNGGTANGGQSTSDSQFTITVTAVNDPPSFTKGANQTVLEDAGPRSVANWATQISRGPANEAAQALNFIVTNNKTALFSAQPAISSTGTLTYTPAPDANGSATVTVYLQDGGSTPGVDTSAPQTFTITVTAVNDAPTFTKGADQQVAVNAAAQTVPGWATAIGRGPVTAVDEVGQTLTFVVTNDNTSLFSVQPAISPATGTLTYTPAAGKTGTANVTVALRDNGSSTLPNVNTSPSQKFKIDVVNRMPAAIPDQYTIDEGAVATPFSVLGNDINGTGQLATNLEITVASSPATGLGGTVTNNTTFVTYLVPDADAFGTDKFIYTIKDTQNPGQGPDTATVTVTIRAVNDAPSFTASNPPAVNEDAGPQAISNWAAFYSGAANENQAVKQYTVSGVSNPALFKAGPSVDTTGKLTYTPADNANGSSEFVVRVQDNGGTTPGVDTSAPQTFTITVNAVNDPPSFVKGPDVAVKVNSGFDNGWATAISPGVDEVGQSLTFFVTNNTNTSLFSQQPSIDPDGTLKFTPATGANGSATVTVYLQDNGGTPGVDTSATQTFTIIVQDVVLSDITGFVYMDMNANGGNGVKDANEPGIGGVKLSLTGTDVNGAPLGGASGKLTTQTGADGSYKFAAVLPCQTGTRYVLTEEQPAGFVDGKETLGAQGSNYSELPAGTNDTMKIALPLYGFPNGIKAQNNNFGENGLSSTYAGGSGGPFGGSGARNDSLDTPGLLFAVSPTNQLLWYANIGGWANYAPGTQSTPGGAFQVTVDNNSTSNTLQVTDLTTNQASWVTIPSGSWKKAGDTSLAVMRIFGQPTDFGLTPSALAPAAEASSLPSSGSSSGYAAAVDSIFSRPGRMFG